MSKGSITNLAALTLVLLGLVAPQAIAPYLMSSGLFALSGAVTNSLAIHMLFEKVPGLYGSGVISLHFETIKTKLREMIMDQFFSPDSLDRFFDASALMQEGIHNMMPSMIDEVDFDRAFDSLVEAIMASSMGSMLGFVGGPKALETLRQPFADRMRDALYVFVESPQFHDAVAKRLDDLAHSDDVMARIELLIDNRLQELTPAQVKELVQRMIKEHLGWLVVWGGVIGGALGLVVALVTNL